RAVPERDRPLSAADGSGGGRAREARREGRSPGEGADDQLEPPPRGTRGQEVPRPRRPLRRPDPGRRDRAEPRGREVRLAEGLQVLDLRDLVDPSGGPALGGGAGPDDPRPDARPRAAPDAEAARTQARTRARAAADERGAREVDRAEAPARRGGARGPRGTGLRQPTRWGR